MHNRTIPSNPGLLRVTLASRGNSAPKNLQQETQRPKCCLYEIPYVAASVREKGDVIARTPPYAWLPTEAPTRARIFFGSWATCFSRDPSCLNTGSCVLFLWGSHMQKQYQERTTLRNWGVQQRALQVSQPVYSTLTWRHEHKPQGTHCKGFCSKEGPHYCFEQSVRNPLWRDQVLIVLGNFPEAVIGQATINLNHKFGNPLGIPYSSCTA